MVQRILYGIDLVGYKQQVIFLLNNIIVRGNKILRKNGRRLLLLLLQLANDESFSFYSCQRLEDMLLAFPYIINLYPFVPFYRHSSWWQFPLSYEFKIILFLLSFLFIYYYYKISALALALALQGNLLSSRELQICSLLIVLIGTYFGNSNNLSQCFELCSLYIFGKYVC